MDRSSAYERDHRQLLAQSADLEKKLEELHIENGTWHTELQKLQAENNALRLENAQLKAELKETKERLAKVETELGDVKTQLDAARYWMQAAEAFNDVNKAVRKAFKVGATGPGYVAMAKKAKRKEMTLEEQAIWTSFLQAHPGAEDEQVVGVFKFVFDGRVQSAHPSVRKMNQEELLEALQQITEGEEDPMLLQRAVELVWTFPL